jgi:N4-gp56 family major capsid protein
MADTLSTITIEAKQYYERDLLYTARKSQIAYKLGKKTNVPQNGGNSVSWRRFNALATVTTALTESLTPTPTPLSLSEVTATISEYGNHVVISNALNLMAIDKMMNESNRILGQNGGESVEQLTFNTIAAGTTVLYATGSARASQGTTNVLTLAKLRQAMATLDANNTHRFSGSEQYDQMGLGGYILLIHPYIQADLLGDSEIKSALQYTSADQKGKIWTGYIASVEGIEIMVSSLCPVFTGAGSAGANVYASLLIGMEAFGCTELAGKGKFELIVKDFGSAGADDPYNQRASIAWHSWQAPTILNNGFMCRIEHGSSIG